MNSYEENVRYALPVADFMLLEMYTADADCVIAKINIRGYETNNSYNMCDMWIVRFNETSIHFVQILYHLAFEIFFETFEGHFQRIECFTFPLSL